MKLLSWNYQGLDNPQTTHALHELISANRPDMVFLSETLVHAQ